MKKMTDNELLIGLLINTFFLAHSFRNEVTLSKRLETAQNSLSAAIIELSITKRLLGFARSSAGNKKMCVDEKRR